MGGEVDGQVTLGEFVNYYTNLGAHIDNDDYFERVVKALWHVDASASTSASYKPSSSTHQSSSGGVSVIDPALISVVAGVKSKPDDSYWNASWGSGRPGYSENNAGMGKRHSAKAMTQTAADLGIQLVLGKLTQELQRRGDVLFHIYAFISYYITTCHYFLYLLPLHISISLPLLTSSFSLSPLIFSLLLIFPFPSHSFSFLSFRCYRRSHHPTTTTAHRFRGSPLYK